MRKNSVLVYMGNQRKNLILCFVTCMSAICSILWRLSASGMEEAFIQNAWTEWIFKMLGIMTAYIVFSYLSNRLMLRQATEFSWSMQSRIERELLEYSAENKDEEASINKIQVDTSNLVKFFRRFWGVFFPNLVCYCLVLCVLFSRHVILGMTVVVCSGVVFLYLMFLGKKLPGYYAGYYEVLDLVLCEEGRWLRNIEMLKMLRNRKLLEDSYDKKLKTLNQADKTAAAKEAWISGPMCLFSFVVMICMAGMAGVLRAKGLISTADLLLTIFTVDIVEDFVMTLDGTISSFQRAKASLNRAESLFKNTKKDNMDYGYSGLEACPDVISISNLKIEYSNGKVVFVDQVVFRKGKINYLQGKNGKGKSTLFKVLTKSLQNYSGDVMLDDINLKNLERSEWIHRVSVCPQDDLIYPDTILGNLFVETPHTDLGEKKARIFLEEVGLLNEVNKLEAGLNTELYSNGKPLSGGQRKRLSIARSWMKENAFIFLYDEPFSSFGGDNKETILSHLSELARDNIVVIISHENLERRDGYVINI
ncbi:MAG: ABC transporter ATP-binding protein [Lachnospiraceae bacterium]|nr:ABC transporter ATP-binding protein [Lachnospiraceae bacterium]